MPLPRTLALLPLPSSPLHFPSASAAAVGSSGQHFVFFTRISSLLPLPPHVLYAIYVMLVFLLLLLILHLLLLRLCLLRICCFIYVLFRGFFVCGLHCVCLIQKRHERQRERERVSESECDRIELKVEVGVKCQHNGTTEAFRHFVNQRYLPALMPRPQIR